MEAEVWLKQSRFVSRVGSRDVAKLIQDRLGGHCPLSREPIVMQPGDEARVVRLTYRPPDPAAEAQVRRAAGSEIGLLKRTA